MERAVECTGIRELLNSHPYDLSGGELQRRRWPTCCWNPLFCCWTSPGSGRLL